ALDADHEVREIRLTGLQHGQACRAVGDTLDRDGLDRGLLAPVLLVRVEHELDTGRHPYEPIGPEADRMTLEAVLTDLLDVLLRHDPGGTGRRGGVEHEKIGPGCCEHET